MKKVISVGAEEKSIMLLKVLAEKPYAYGITELSEKIGYSKGGVHRLVTGLVEGGMVRQRKDKKYALGIGVYLLGLAYEAGEGFGSVIKPVLRRLRDETNENAMFAVWENETAVMLYREESTQVIRVTGTVGSTRPPNASAVGTLLAAYADEALMREKIEKTALIQYTPKTIVDADALFAHYAVIRRQGYAVSHGEFTPGSWGLAAPVRNAQGVVWAALSLGAPEMRIDPEKEQRYIELVCRAADDLSAQMRF